MKNSKTLRLGLAFAIISLTSIQISGSEPTRREYVKGQRTIQSKSQQPAPNTGFSFGSGGFSTTPQAQPAPATSGFSFGTPAQTQTAPSTGGFSFGTTPQAQPAQTTGASFGTAAIGGFNFGNNPTTPQPQPAPNTGFSFTTPAQPQPTLQSLQQASQVSTEAIKMLADKITALDQAVKAMQIDLVTLKEIVTRDHSTAIRRFNEALQDKK